MTLAGFLKLLAIVAILLTSLVVYHRVMKANNMVTPPEMAELADQADMVVVDKSERVLRLLRDGTIIREYEISLGGSPVGHKVMEGDQKTPSGEYMIDWRNPNSIAFLSLHISYPNSTDTQAANDLASQQVAI